MSHSTNAVTPREVVLVVDDDREIVTLLEKSLERRFDVLSTPNGHEALHLLERYEIAAVIADYMMPGITGVDLLNFCHELQPRAARILITALDRTNIMRDAINVARVHRVLSKPLRIVSMPEIVAGAIREARLEAENARLVTELKNKNEELSRAVAELERQRQELEEKFAERTQQLEIVVNELKSAALKDGLTGLYNHGYFHEALEAEIARSKRHNHSIGLLFIDVDHFKQYNDRMGHPAGDRLLMRLANIVAGKGGGDTPRARRSDVAARYGGEEFVVILPETNLNGALVRAERLRAAVCALEFEGGAEQPLGCVSVSIGVAGYPDDGLEKKDLIEVADRGLYAAKRAGRNRVCYKEAEKA